jgi:FlaG/FlaF family flagellin (archaellin)
MKTLSNNHAVSPVVGVMLMLVVTIIIAAVVSAFAGGMGSGAEKVSQASMKCSYSQSQGIKVEHMGGDPLGTRNIQMWVKAGDSMGGGGFQKHAINASSIWDGKGNTNSNYWLTPSGMAGVKTFTAGDIAYVMPPYHEGPFLQPLAASSSWFNSSRALGATMVIEFTDTKGNLFATCEAPISP